jgi:hypothetical protein
MLLAGRAPFELHCYHRHKLSSANQATAPWVPSVKLFEHFIRVDVRSLLAAGSGSG